MERDRIDTLCDSLAALGSVEDLCIQAPLLVQVHLLPATLSIPHITSLTYINMNTICGVDLFAGLHNKQTLLHLVVEVSGYPDENDWEPFPLKSLPPQLQTVHIRFAPYKASGNIAQVWMVKYSGDKMCHSLMRHSNLCHTHCSPGVTTQLRRATTP